MSFFHKTTIHLPLFIECWVHVDKVVIPLVNSHARPRLLVWTYQYVLYGR
jgi:hypothetical protein